MEQAVEVYQEQPERHFNPNSHMRQIKSREGSQDYLDVKWRLVWFREQCPQGTIATEMVLLDLDRETEEEAYVWNQEKKRSEKVLKRANGFAVFRATVTDGKGASATATKSEKAASFGEYIEKAETGSVGRALAMLGYGTQFAIEMDEKVVDAPVDRKAPKTDRSYQERKPFVEGSVAVQEESNLATEQQVASIRKLLQHLGLPEEIRADLRYLEAKDMITELSRQYNEQRQKKNVEQPADEHPLQPTSTDNAPVPSKLRKLFESIGTTLETAQKMTLGEVKAMDNLTPEECFKLRQVYDAWKKRHEEKQASRKEV